MKKLILCGSALMLSLGFASAQAGWTSTGAHDDFGTDTEFDDISWGSDVNFTLSRPGTGVLDITTVGAVGRGATNQWPVFSVDFTSMDFSGGNADILIDVENTTSGILLMKIELEDGDGDKSDIEPSISDVLVTHTWGDLVGGKPPRKANNGLVLAAETRGTFRIDLSSVPAFLGGLTRTGWVGTGGCTTDGPFCGPVTAYQIDPSDIVKVLFTVNYYDDAYIISQGESPAAPTDDYIIDPASDVPSINGTIKIHDFKIGSKVVTGITKATEIENSINVYPNPASDALNVSFDATSSSDVTLSDLSGMNVFSVTGNAGQNNISVNTANLSSGMYILNVATENGKVARKVTIK